jgi:transcriptional regulator with GAF, ATPase, and Fis domain
MSEFDPNIHGTPIEFLQKLTTAGFQAVTHELQALKNAQKELDIRHEKETAKTRQQQRALAQATYKAATSSGKSRFAAELVKIEGSQAKAAKYLDLTPSRIAQLIKSEKNKDNGK